VHVLPELYRAVSVKREDMTARTIIAKLVAFLFVHTICPFEYKIYIMYRYFY
jgi:hypothetical protein